MQGDPGCRGGQRTPGLPSQPHDIIDKRCLSVSYVMPSPPCAALLLFPRKYFLGSSALSLSRLGQSEVRGQGLRTGQAGRLRYFSPFSTFCGIFDSGYISSGMAAPLGQDNCVQLWNHSPPPPCLSSRWQGLPLDTNLWVASPPALWFPRDSITCVIESQYNILQF